MVEAARGLAGAGQAINESTLESVRETLHAAALDPEAREQVEAARLTRGLSAAGFGLTGLSTSAPAEHRGGKGRQRKARDGKTGDGEQATADPARRLRAAEDELESAREGAKQTRAAVSDARRELKEATAVRDRSQRGLERAEAEADLADRRLKSAREAVKRLRRS